MPNLIVLMVMALSQLILCPSAAHSNYLFQRSKRESRCCNLSRIILISILLHMAALGEDANEGPEVWLVENDVDYAVMMEDSAHPIENGQVDYGSERRLDWIRHSVAQQELSWSNRSDDDPSPTPDDTAPPATPIKQPRPVLTLDIHPNMDIHEVREVQGRSMLQNMDVDTNPCDDFYQYACEFRLTMFVSLRRMDVTDQVLVHNVN